MAYSLAEVNYVLIQIYLSRNLISVTSSYFSSYKRGHAIVLVEALCISQNFAASISNEIIEFFN
jgi:hypothetical protein